MSLLTVLTHHCHGRAFSPASKQPRKSERPPSWWSAVRRTTSKRTNRSTEDIISAGLHSVITPWNNNTYIRMLTVSVISVFITITRVKLSLGLSTTLSCSWILDLTHRPQTVRISSHTLRGCVRSAPLLFKLYAHDWNLLCWPDFKQLWDFILRGN